ncbi:MDR family MFS transporter [Actinocorallia longicatena]|uniref:MDR family MFS transporter n=1 Tax=Actinocorallia longicatena TaxID=111803 RepID=A0ABP6Q9N5_9ACTN
MKITPKVAVSVVFVAAMFVSILDTTIVNVALPKIAEGFGVPVTGIGSMVTGYLVSLAVVIPASGWLADRFGAKRVFLFAFALFTVASALCGFAADEGQLIAFRILQGVGGGMLTPVGMAMLLRAYPPAERMRANQILMVPTAIAPALGPVLGGLLVDGVGWRWVFFINLPIGLAAIVFGALTLPEHRDNAAGRFDLAGFVLAGAGFAGLMYALSEGSGLGWGSARVLVTGLGGVVLLALLAVVELRKREPMLHLRLYSDRLFRWTNVSSIFSAAGFMGVLFLIPLMLQEGHGFSALHAGLYTFPEALGVMLGSQLVPRMYRRVGPRRMMGFGLAIVAALILLAGWVTGPLIPVVMFFLGYVMAHVFIPASTAAFTTVSKGLSAQASTLFTALRQLGAALGIALLSTVLAVARPEGAAPTTGTYHWAFLAAAVMSLIGSAIAWKINDADAAPTMVPAKVVTVEPEPVPA